MRDLADPTAPGAPVAQQLSAAVGALRTVAIEGQAAPKRLGGRYARIGSASVNDAGAVVFAADLVGSTTGAAIVRLANGRSTALVRARQPAPGGGRYAGFGAVDLGEDGRLLFQARLSECAASEGLFLQTPSGVELVAHAGPGCDYATFEQLSLVSYPLDGGAYFRLSYVVRRADGARSLVIWPSYRAPSTVLTSGQSAAGGVVEDFSASRLAFAACLVVRVRRDSTIRHVAVLASEDQLISGPRLRDGAGLPQLGRISRLLAAPAMYVHYGFVAAELDDGRTVLLSRSGGAEPEVVAHSGEPAPGLPERRIARFGPPLANHGLPDAGPCGVCSVVTLDDGTTALWLAVLTGQQPITGAAVTPLLAGDDTDDRTPVRLDTFAPVKLTNTGKLLLASTVDIDGRPRNALLTIDKLFDWHQSLALSG